MNAPAPTFGRYLLGPRLAVGGMGEVHVATQLGMGEFAKPLVLKLLLPHLAAIPRAVEMFLTEARLASRMNHPNVVHIFDVGVIDGRHFIAMELVRGVALSKLMQALGRTGQKLEPDVIFFIARCLCDGLHHAHEQRGPDGRPLGLIHRDVTPENVLLGVEGQVKLTDFGVARAQDQAPDGHVVGKLGYIAPEQLERMDIDRRVDLFSTAVTLFNLATGEKPFHRATRSETLHALRDEPLPDLRALRPDLPPSFADALEKATKKNPAERFATARELRDALPPPTQGATSEQLGALVLSLCGDQLVSLDANVERTVSLRAATAQLSPSPAPQTVATEVERRPRWPLAVGVVAVAIGAVAGVTALMRGDGETVAPTVVDVPVVAAPPVAVAEPVPEPEPVAEPVAPTPEPTPPLVAKGTKGKSPVRRPVKKVTAETPVKSTAAAQTGEPGFVVVDATPWAMVSINGKSVGETPIAAYPLPPGPAVVELRNPETGKSLVRNVNVLRGERAYVKGDLR